MKIIIIIIIIRGQARRAVIRGQARRAVTPIVLLHFHYYYYYYYYYYAKNASLFTTLSNLKEGYVRVQEQLIT